MMKRLSFNLLILPLLMVYMPEASTAGNTAAVSFKVQTRDSLPSGEVVFLAGQQNELGIWSPSGLKLERRTARLWTGKIAVEKGTFLQFKVTRGSWSTEAVDSLGIEYPNLTGKISGDTTIHVHIYDWRDRTAGRPVISLSRLRNKGGQIEFFENWKFKEGDNPDWASPQYPDTSWMIVASSHLQDYLEESDWTGIGWFRMHLRVDSSLWNRTLAFNLFHTGAAELYLNGERLYAFGKVSSVREEEKRILERNPKAITFAAHGEQLIAVRYSNHSDNPLFARGFFLVLQDLNDSIEGRVHAVRYISILQSIFTVIPLILALIHFLLFLFYRTARENLFYALFMFSFALLSYSNFFSYTSGDADWMKFHRNLLFISVNLAVIFGLLTTYWHAHLRIPSRFLVFLVISAAFVVWKLFTFGAGFNLYFFGYLILVGIELIRVIVLPFFRRKNRKDLPLVIGFVALVVAITYQMLLDTGILQPVGNYEVVYVYGILVLGMTMSINLARDFASTNLRLIEQDREARDREIERRLLEADNERKTKELEEARNLQLSMLPTEIPEMEQLEIAVYMKTATEVGGDYYDFLVEDDNTLTVVIGDATGHGTKAGIMVALIKNIFNTMGHTFFIPDFFAHCTKLIRKMRLGMMYMSLTLLRIRKNRATFSAAGMPPILLYRAGTGSVEQLVLKGLPLGGFESAAYEQKSVSFSDGDTLLLMTDGYVELFNPDLESMDYPRIIKIMEEHGGKPAGEIIEILVRKGKEWAAGHPQGDDITFIVLKFSGNAQNTNESN